MVKVDDGNWLTRKDLRKLDIDGDLRDRIVKQAHVKYNQDGPSNAYCYSLVDLMRSEEFRFRLIALVDRIGKLDLTNKESLTLKRIKKLYTRADYYADKFWLKQLSGEMKRVERSLGNLKKFNQDVMELQDNYNKLVKDRDNVSSARFGLHKILAIIRAYESATDYSRKPAVVINPDLANNEFVKSLFVSVNDELEYAFDKLVEAGWDKYDYRAYKERHLKKVAVPRLEDDLSADDKETLISLHKFLSANIHDFVKNYNLLFSAGLTIDDFDLDVAQLIVEDFDVFDSDENVEQQAIDDLNLSDSDVDFLESVEDAELSTDEESDGINEENQQKDSDVAFDELDEDNFDLDDLADDNLDLDDANEEESDD